MCHRSGVRPRRLHASLLVFVVRGIVQVARDLSRPYPRYWRFTRCRLRQRWQTVRVPADGLHLLLDEGLAASAVADTLAAQIPIVSHKAQTIERTFWDTFDGRVRGAGLALVEAGGRLALVDAQSYAEQAAAPCKRGSSRLLTGDLAAGALRERLEPLIEMRALAPVARVRSRQLPLNVLDDLGKIVVRLRVEEPTAVGGGDDGRLALPARLHVIGVLGYDRELREVSELLERPRARRRAAAGSGRRGGGARRQRRRHLVEAEAEARSRRPRRRGGRGDPAPPARDHRREPAGDARRHGLGVPPRPARRGAPHARAAARAARRLRARAAAGVSRRLQGAAAHHGPDARPRRAAARVRRARGGPPGGGGRRRRPAAPAARGPPRRRAPHDGPRSALGAHGRAA